MKPVLLILVPAVALAAAGCPDEQPDTERAVAEAGKTAQAVAASADQAGSRSAARAEAGAAPAAASASPSGPAVPARPSLVLDRGKPLTLAGGQTLALVKVIREELLGPPQGPGGDTAVITVKLGGDTLDLVDGPPGYNRPVRWSSRYRIQLDGAMEGQVKLWVDRRTDTPVEGSVRTVRVERKKTIPLHGDLQLEFSGHGHKTVGPGRSSPLSVAVRYLRDVRQEEDQQRAVLVDSGSYSLDPPEENSWIWRDYRFVLKKHEYDQWMELEIARLMLDPVEAVKQAGTPLP